MPPTKRPPFRPTPQRLQTTLPPTPRRSKSAFSHLWRRLPRFRPKGRRRRGDRKRRFFFRRRFGRRFIRRRGLFAQRFLQRRDGQKTDVSLDAAAFKIGVFSPLTPFVALPPKESATARRSKAAVPPTTVRATLRPESSRSKTKLPPTPRRSKAAVFLPASARSALRPTTRRPQTTFSPSASVRAAFYPTTRRSIPAFSRL